MPGLCGPVIPERCMTRRDSPSWPAVSCTSSADGGDEQIGLACGRQLVHVSGENERRRGPVVTSEERAEVAVSLDTTTRLPTSAAARIAASLASARPASKTGTASWPAAVSRRATWVRALEVRVVGQHLV